MAGTGEPYAFVADDPVNSSDQNGELFVPANGSEAVPVPGGDPDGVPAPSSPMCAHAYGPYEIAQAMCTPEHPDEKGLFEFLGLSALGLVALAGAPEVVAAVADAAPGTGAAVSGVTESAGAALSGIAEEADAAANSAFDRLISQCGDLAAVCNTLVGAGVISVTSSFAQDYFETQAADTGNPAQRAQDLAWARAFHYADLFSDVKDVVGQ